MLHPLEKFAYCPVCGSKHFEEQDFKSKKCGNCGFEYFLNPSSATAAFIVNDNDSDCRESYLFLTPGLGSGAHQPDRYRLIAIE